MRDTTTPRTDEVAYDRYLGNDLVSGNFARELERECQELRRALINCCYLLDELNYGRGLDAEIQRAIVEYRYNGRIALGDKPLP
jgi:hypothetical protein